MRTDDNIENHMVLNTPDALWNQPDAPEETAVERLKRERAEQAAKARTEFCDALVDIAEFLETHPDCPLPHHYLFQNFYSREEFLNAAVALARGGKVKKSSDPPEKEYGQYRVIRMFGPIKVEFVDSLLEAGKEFEEAQ